MILSIFSFPIIPAGPALIALFTITLKMLRGGDGLNPVVEFWRAFKSNFRQGMIVWLIFLLIAFIAISDIRFLVDSTGFMRYFKYMVYFVSGAFLVFFVHLLPVIAAFREKRRGLLLLDSALAFALAAAAEGVSFAAGRGMIYTALFTAIFGAGVLALNGKKA